MQKAANGGGGIFKTAAAEILRAERRLMSTGEAAHLMKLIWLTPICRTQTAGGIDTSMLAERGVRGSPTEKEQAALPDLPSCKLKQEVDLDSGLSFVPYAQRYRVESIMQLKL